MGMELLAPAGDMERLRMAVTYGADAVYLAGNDFGMRAFAGNFDWKGLREAVALCHGNGVSVHVTCNTMPRCGEVDRLPEWLEYLDAAGVDAAIVADLGVFRLAQRYAPRLKLHVSTQAGVSNHEAARAWHELGASRGHPGPGALPGGNPGDPGQDTSLPGDRGLCPRGHVRELFRAVPPVQLHGGPGRAARYVRPALPLSVCADGGKAARRVFPRL